MNKSSEYINTTSREYSIYTCESRAIPKATDGLKDAQRKALWLIRNKADKVKTISLAGELLSSGLYHHGDKPAADAISGLAATYSNNIPFLTGKGTFGSRVNPKAIGAPRYTYVRRSNAAQQLIYADLDIVPQVENYDGSTMEPLHFLPIVPIALMNGISGIAVGYSTEILPHNIKDLIKGCEQVLNDKKQTKLKPNFTKFDMEVDHIEGNSWEFKGRIDRVDGSNIRIIDLPVDMSLEKFKIKLDALEDEGTIKNYDDLTTDRINVKIKFPRGQVNKMTDEEIIKKLKLKTRKTQRITVIGWDNNGIIQYDNPEEYVKDFVEWRLTWYVKRYENLLLKSQTALPYYQALEECYENNLLDIVKICEDRQQTLDCIKELVKEFDLSDDQISKIAGIPLYKWNQEGREENKKVIKQTLSDIKDYKKILSDDEQIKQIYLNELSELKKIKF